MALKTFTRSAQPTNFKRNSSPLYQFLMSDDCPEFTLPSNKVALTGMHMDIFATKHPDGKNRLLKKGFTAVSYHCHPIECIQDDGFTRQNILEPVANSFYLEVAPASADPNTWDLNALLNGNSKYLLLDGETLPSAAFSPYNWTNTMLRKMNGLQTMKRNLGHYIGNWFSPYINRTFLIIDQYDGGTNAIDHYYAIGGQGWEHPLYNNYGGTYNTFQSSGGEAGSAFNSPPDNLAGNMATVYWYDSKNYGAKVHYGAIALLEIGELQKATFNFPGFLNLSSIWNIGEIIDGDIYSDIEYKGGASNARIKGKGKTMASRAYLRGSTIFSTCLGNGIYIFGDEIVRLSDNPTHSKVDGEGYITSRPITITKNGQTLNNRQLQYPNVSYAGYDEVYLALWQLSQDPIKGILEANTPWTRPDYRIGAGNTGDLKTGSQLIPRLAYEQNLPIIRMKTNVAGTQAVVIAWNPSEGLAEQTYSVNVGGANHCEVLLRGGWPEIGVVNL